MAIDLWNIAIQAGGALVILLVGGILLGTVALIVYYVQKNKQFSKYTVLIWKRFKDKDGGETPYIYGIDKGAIIKDKKLKKWVFHIKKWNLDCGEEEGKGLDENRDLDIPSIPGANGTDWVFLERVGPRKAAIGQPYLMDGTVMVKVSTADVAEAVRAYDINARTFGVKDNKLLAFTFYVILAVMVLIMIIVVLNKFEMISEAAKYFKEGAAAMHQGAAVASNAPG